MGLQLFCPLPDGPVPRAVHMRLTCEFEHRSDLYTEQSIPSQVYSEGGYPAMRSAASADGWKKIGGKWSCPAHRK